MPRLDPVRVLFVSGEYPPDVGGVGDYTARLRAALAERSVPSDLLSRGDVGRWNARALLKLARAAPRQGVVHIQYQPAAFDLLGDVCLMPLLIRVGRPGVRVVTTLHDARVPYLFPGAGRLRWTAVRLLARTSHALVAADERDLRAVGAATDNVVPIGSNVLCQLPADFSRGEFRQQLHIGARALVVVYFGLLNASKGLDMVLDAFEHISLVRPDARLLLVGGSHGASDPTDRATAAVVGARLKGFGERLIRTGYLEASAVSAYLAAADVALLPYVDGASARRGSLLACAEHGLPIVSTLPTSDSVADAVLPVAVGDVPALAAAVLRVADDPELAARLRAGSAALAERASWSRIAERHVALYEALLRR